MLLSHESGGEHFLPQSQLVQYSLYILPFKSKLRLLFPLLDHGTSGLQEAFLWRIACSCPWKNLSTGFQLQGIFKKVVHWPIGCITEDVYGKNNVNVQHSWNRIIRSTIVNNQENVSVLFTILFINIQQLILYLQSSKLCYFIDFLLDLKWYFWNISDKEICRSCPDRQLFTAGHVDPDY